MVGGFCYQGHSSQSQNQHLQAIQGININFFDAPLQRSLPPITFTDRDFKGINPVNQDDTMVFSINILNFMVSRVLIDQGSSFVAPVDVLWVLLLLGDCLVS